MSSCETDFCDKFYLPKLKANPFIKVTKSLKKEFNAIQRKGATRALKRDRAFCISRYCNPTCKDTLITEKKDTAAMKKEFKQHLASISFSKSNRKDEAKGLNNYKKTVRKMVKKYKDPLNNGFYKGLSSVDIKRLKEAGATSGCTPELQRHIKDYGFYAKSMRALKTGSLKEFTLGF
jgi:hypothetical protein